MVKQKLRRYLAQLFEDMTRDIIAVDEIEAEITECYGSVAGVEPGLGDSFIVRWTDGSANRVTVSDYHDG